MEETKKKVSVPSRMRVSLKIQVLMLSILSAIIAISLLGVMTLSRINKLVREDTTNHLNDFLVAHSKKLESAIIPYEERIKSLVNAYARMNANEMLQMQVDRFSKDGNQNDNIIIADKSGKIIVATNHDIIGTQLSKEKIQIATTKEEKIEYSYHVDKEKNSIFIDMSTSAYIDGEIAGYIVYYAEGTALNEAMNDYVLTGIAQPQFNLVDLQGTIIAHSDPSQIGEVAENPFIVRILEEVRKGNYPQGVCYESASFAKDTAGLTYMYMPDTELLFAVGTLESVIYKNVAKVKQFFRLGFIISLIFITLISLVTTRYISLPIAHLADVLRDLGQLNFIMDHNSIRYKRNIVRNDEIGEMYRALDNMVGAMKEKLSFVDEVSEKVNIAAVHLLSATDDITEKADETSAITQQLSAGMEETTASTELIASDITGLQENIAEMKLLVDKITESSKVIEQRASQVRNQSSVEEENTRKMFLSIKDKSALAIEQSKAVNQIHELAQAIMGIADQTSLLSLNASIEAARAGESGRGFAVVASEIGSLAQQSADTVGKISQIVAEVNEAVRNIVECLNTSQEFVESSVYGTYECTRKVMGQYEEDTQNTNKLMDVMKTNTEMIASTIKGINDSIHAINDTVQESAIGIADIAQRNSEINELINESCTKVNETKLVSDELTNSLKDFKL